MKTNATGDFSHPWQAYSKPLASPNSLLGLANTLGTPWVHLAKYLSKAC